MSCGGSGPTCWVATSTRRKPSDAFAREASETIADVLLNQRVMAGVGNVYKSEVLFACGVNPFRPASEVTDAEVQI